MKSPAHRGGILTAMTCPDLRPLLLGLFLLLTACEELPPGTLDRDWPARDAALDATPDTPDTAPPDAQPLDEAIAPLDLTPPPDRDPPPPICALEDTDGDGYGQHPDCPTPDCDDHNRNIRPGGLEACNAIDDDCDGIIDESLNTAICGIGACRREQNNCIDGIATRCQPADPTPEACNAIDDDCDGVTDEAAPTATCGEGICRSTAACLDGIEQPCEPAPPADELCNRADDDCDGRTDEGYLAEVVVTAYSTLAAHHATCDGGNQRIGPHCNAAMSRFCASRGCGVTGFGPIENSGDTAIVTCLASVVTLVVPFAELATRHAGCNGQNQRIGPECNAAIHRHCQSLGHVSGFGPIESGADDVTITCIGAGAEVRVVPYATLAGHHAPCNGAGQRIGPDCNAAMHRWCSAQGYVSGFGPVENSGGDATVTCVRR
jgi:hypothetical protein